MRVKLLVGFSGPTVDWRAGTEQEIDDAEAVRLIAGGYAVPVSTAEVETTSAKPARETRKK